MESGNEKKRGRGRPPKDGPKKVKVPSGRGRGRPPKDDGKRPSSDAKPQDPPSAKKSKVDDTAQVNGAKRGPKRN